MPMCEFDSRRLRFMLNFKYFFESKVMDQYFNVGVVGYSKSNFDHSKAENLIKKAFDEIENKYPDKQKNCVSGWTNQGVPAIAYAEAVKRGWKTTGVACGKVKVKKYDMFPVDYEYLEGEQWGDESKKFLSLLDVIVRVGGGKQSFNEIESAKEKNLPVFEFDLDLIEK